MVKKPDKMVPEVRFKGFTDDWGQRKLKNLSVQQKSYSLPRKYETTKDTGIKYIHYGDIHTGKAMKINDPEKLPSIIKDNYSLLKKGDIVVADASEDYKGIADAAILLDTRGFSVIAGLHTIAFRPNLQIMNPLFVYYIFQTNRFKHYSYRVGTGLKVFGISSKLLFEYLISYPSQKEQQNIEHCISLLEKLIDLQQRKLEQLKQLKKAMLQQLFADQHKVQPITRFKGFNDDWDQCKLGNIIGSIKSGNRLPKTNLKSGNIPYVVAQTNNKGVFMYIDKNTKDYNGHNLKLFPNNSISFSIDNPEALFYRDSYFFTSNIMRVIHVKNFIKEDYLFLLEILKSKTRSFDWSRKFSGPVVSNLKVIIPKSNEVKKIGKFIDKIDSRLNQQQLLLKQLKTIKKFLLQKLFI